jgi:hypothetical protein
MRRSSVVSSLIIVLVLIISGPVFAVSRDDDTGTNQSRPLPQDKAVQPEMNRLELAYHALAATCIRHPKGLGLAAAVAPGQPFSMPPLNPDVVHQLASGGGALGWMLPKVLGQAALILRPDGSCSILIREISPDKSDNKLKEIFTHLENLRLKHLEKKVCVIAGVPTTTKTYSMIPSNAEDMWGHPVVKYDQNGLVLSRVWRGFLLNISARLDKNHKYSMVLTTYVGHHVLGQDCQYRQPL